MSRDDFWRQRLQEPWHGTALQDDVYGTEWEAGATRRDPRRVRARVEAAVEHWVTMARTIPALARSERPPIPVPKVVYDLKLGGVAGMAVTVGRRVGSIEQWIRINPDLMQRYPVRMIQQTIPHEVAHLVVDWYRPHAREPDHGPAWMAVMVYFGRPPAAFHTMKRPRQGTPRRRETSQLPIALGSADCADDAAL